MPQEEPTYMDALSSFFPSLHPFNSSFRIAANKQDPRPFTIQYFPRQHFPRQPVAVLLSLPIHPWDINMLCEVCKTTLDGIWDPSWSKRLAFRDDLRCCRASELSYCGEMDTDPITGPNTSEMTSSTLRFCPLITMKQSYVPP